MTPHLPQPANPVNVAAVVVTFNRKQLLIECLRGLLSQTVALDKIYVIDNASTDGTKEALEQAGLLSNPVIQYAPLRDNLGGAGGFAAGLEIAYDNGHQWFWLMDDDVEPYPDGLAELLKASPMSGCIHGRRKDPNGEPVPWGVRLSEKTVTTVEIPDQQFQAGTGPRVVNTACFEGMLVSREVVSRIGFPDANFFIMWDDTYYGYLAAQVTTVLYIDAFVLRRKLPVRSTKLPGCKTHFLPTSLGLFYFQRNRWLVARRLGVCRFPFWAATAFLVAKALFRELVLVRSPGRAGIVIKGLVHGIRCQVNATQPLSLPKPIGNAQFSPVTQRDSINLPV